MLVPIDRYHHLAWLVGSVLTLVGTALVATFVVSVAIGVEPLADTVLRLEGPGVLIFASVGAFALPLGLSLFRRDAATSARLRIAAGALGLLAVLRLVAFLSADLRAAVGLVPLIEAGVLGAIAWVGLWVRPEGEAPIEIHMALELEVPATAAWHVLADRFGDVAEFSSGLASSSLDGPVGVGVVRTCETHAFGPFAAARITEELAELDPGAMRLRYVAGGGLPRFIPSSQNRWSVEALGPQRCRVRSHASVELRWWALPLAPLLGWSIRGEVERFGRDLREHVERGVVPACGIAATP